MPATITDLRIGTRRDEGGRDSRDFAYVGVIRQSRKIVVECGHRHTNRDDSSQTGGKSARDCITDIVRAARDEAFAADLVEKTRTRSSRPRSGGFQVSATTLERWKAADAEDAIKLDALIDAVRALNIQDPATPARRGSEPKVQEIGDPDDPAYAWMFE